MLDAGRANRILGEAAAVGSDWKGSSVPKNSVLRSFQARQMPTSQWRSSASSMSIAATAFKARFSSLSVRRAENLLRTAQGLRDRVLGPAKERFNYAFEALGAE